MRHVAPSPLPSFILEAYAWLVAYAHELRGRAPESAAPLRFCDTWLERIIHALARTYVYVRYKSRIRRPHAHARGFAMHGKIKNSNRRFWMHGILPRRARTGVGALARLQLVLRKIDEYVARLVKRLVRGYAPRIVAIAPPARLLYSAAQCVDAVSVNSS